MQKQTHNKTSCISTNWKERLSYF